MIFLYLSNKSMYSFYNLVVLVATTEDISFFIRKLHKLISSLYDLGQTDFFNRNFVPDCYVFEIRIYLIMICNSKRCRRSAATVNNLICLYICQPD